MEPSVRKRPQDDSFKKLLIFYFSILISLMLAASLGVKWDGDRVIDLVKEPKNLTAKR